MKKTIYFILLSLILCGCKAEEAPSTTAAEATVVTTTISESSEDGEIKRIEAVLSTGEVLTLCVQGKQDPDNGLYGVREIWVYRGGSLIQTLSMADAIAADGVDGIAPGYTMCFTAEETAAVKDVNFDGEPDLEVFGWSPNNAIPYYYWIWDMDEARFKYAFLLQLREVDYENRQLVAWYKVENGLYYTDYYQINELNGLELLKRETEDVRPK